MNRMHIVTRIDLIPHREELQVMYAGGYGKMMAERIDVGDFKKFDYESLDAVSIE